MQTNSLNDYDEIFSFLILVNRKLAKPFEEHFKDKFTSLQFNILCVLQAGGSTTMTHLAQTIHITKQQLTKIIDKLAEDGHIIRSHDNHDKRCINISISKETDVYISQRRKKYIEHLNDAFHNLSDEDYKMLIASIHNINQVLGKKIKLD